MRVLAAVVADLWEFALGALVSRRRPAPALVAVASPIAVEPVSAPLSLPARTGTLPPTAPPPRPLPPVPPRLPAEPSPLPAAMRRNTIVYVSVPRARLRATPEKGADNMLVRVPYGAMVMAIEANDEWTRAYYRGTEGWLAADEVAGKAAAVYPQFSVGAPNYAKDEATMRVRAVIDDEFSCGERMLPLAGEEYVLYKLVRRGTSVSWPDARPRLPGRWAEIFRNDSGQVTESLEPVERSVMEWHHGNGKGHLAYVESVHEDGSIRISEADWPRDGAYNERVLLKEEWQGLQPVFLVFG